jgi:hypothetical protein
MKRWAFAHRMPTPYHVQIWSCVGRAAGARAVPMRADHLACDRAFCELLCGITQGRAQVNEHQRRALCNPRRVHTTQN